MKRLFCGVMMVMALAAMQAEAEKAGPADANSDGKLTKQEFCEFHSNRVSKAGQKFNKVGTEKQFDAKDTNGDGFLAGDELAAKPKAPAVK